MEIRMKQITHFFSWIIEKNIRIFIFLMTAGILLKFGYLFLISFIWQPSGVDFLGYIQAGQKLLNHEIPYRDFGDYKPYLFYFIYALFIKIFGYANSIEAIKVLDMLSQAGGAFFLFKIGEVVFDRKKGFCMGILFILGLSVHYELWYSNVMIPSLFPLLAGIYFLSKEVFQEQRLIHWLFSGLLLGIAFSISTNFVFYGLFFPVFAVYLYRSVKKSFLPVLISGVFFLLPFFLVLFYYWIEGALKDWFWWNWEWANIYSESSSILKKIGNIVEVFWKTWMWFPVFIYFFITIYLMMKEKKENKSKVVFFVLTVLFLAFLSRIVFPRGSARYLPYLLPAFLIVAGYSLDKIKNKLIIGFFTLIFAGGLVWSYQKAFYFSYEKIETLRKPIIQTIQENSNEGDKIFVWFEGYEIYLYSNRKMATHSWSSCSQLVPDEVWANHGCKDIDIPFEKFLNELKRDQPVLIVDQKPDFGGFFDFNSMKCAQLKEYIIKLKNYISENYLLINEVESIDLWRNKQAVRIWKRKN